ncbi:vacuolar protein sorting-associated protein VPS28 [Chytriomyces sp. MP71]|nr:vacuolar protein sorting-associated protein VPS28 [Chytriomyces sp. MP71]
MDSLVKLSHRETENLDACADLFSILLVTEALEKAYIRDAVSAADYTANCTRLIAQFKTARDLLPAGTSIEQFMRDYKLSAPAAYKRLIEIGVPATVEHAVADNPSTANKAHIKAVADITTCFITLMDCIKLNMTAMDQLHPLLSDLLQFLNKVQGLPKDFEDVHKDRLKKWLITLHKMKASDSLGEEQSRQLLFELDSANQSFHASLSH